MNAFAVVNDANVVMDLVADAVPAGIDRAIVQPIGPIEKYCWILKRSAGGNNVYRCKLCQKEFTGSKIVAATHFDPRVSSQQLKKCRAQQPPDLVAELAVLVAERVATETKKRSFEESKRVGLTTGSNFFAAQTQPLADAAILRFIVCQGLAPSLVHSESFRDMVKACRDAPRTYKPPTSHSLGKNSLRSPDEC